MVIREMIMSNSVLEDTSMVLKWLSNNSLEFQAFPTIVSGDLSAGLDELLPAALDHIFLEGPGSQCFAA